MINYNGDLLCNHPELMNERLTYHFNNILFDDAYVYMSGVLESFDSNEDLQTRLKEALGKDVQEPKAIYSTFFRNYEEYGQKCVVKYEFIPHYGKDYVEVKKDPCPRYKIYSYTLDSGSWNNEKELEQGIWVYRFKGASNFSKLYSRACKSRKNLLTLYSPQNNQAKAYFDAQISSCGDEMDDSDTCAPEQAFCIYRLLYSFITKYPFMIVVNTYSPENKEIYVSIASPNSSFDDDTRAEWIISHGWDDSENDYTDSDFDKLMYAEMLLNKFMTKHIRNKAKEEHKHIFDNWDKIKITDEQLSMIDTLITESEGQKDIICDLDHFALDRCAIIVKLNPNLPQGFVEELAKLDDGINDFSGAVDFISNTFVTMPIFYEKDGDRLKIWIDYSLHQKMLFLDPNNSPGKVRIETIQKSRINPVTGIQEMYIDKDESVYQLNKFDKEYWTANLQGKTMFQTVIHWIFLVNTFLLYYKDVGIEEIEERVYEGGGSGNYRPSANRNTVVKKYKTYRIRKDWVPPATHKPHVITCDAWGVAGHTRKYKSGKTIVIKPYVKGKHRLNYKGKEYKLLPPQPDDKTD